LFCADSSAALLKPLVVSACSDWTHDCVDAALGENNDAFAPPLMI
jgi:hypothetical protein